MSSTDRPVVTRFAPSPTGHLHIGGARTALFCWAYARRHGGRFILRIEDTDQARSSEQAARGILDDLAWLGITWDEGPEFTSDTGVTCGGGEHGPYFQAQRLEIYTKYFDQLIEAGHAYPAFETQEELDEQRKQAQLRQENYRYDRAALTLTKAEVEQRIASGEPYVVRLKTPDHDITVHDAVLGDVTVTPQEMDDFIIRKRDGFPTYHFAVVIDDHLMGVTHVLRGQEHLNNTPKHLALMEALGFHPPTFAHLSLIFNQDGSKMSKRDKDKAVRTAVREQELDASPVEALDDDAFRRWLKDKKSQLDTDTLAAMAGALSVHLPEIEVEDFRAAGYLPETMCNYIALLGWSPGGDVEQFDQDFLAARFDLDRIIKSPAKFDRDKLLAFSLRSLQEMSEDEFVARLRRHYERQHPDFIAQFDEQAFDLYARCNKDRSKTLEDAYESCLFFVRDDDEITYETTKPVRKALVNGDPNGFALLEALLPELEAADDWTVNALNAIATSYAERHADGKLGKVAQPLRIAVTGGVVSPAIFETLEILGRERTLARIRRLLAQRNELFA
jgi:glutamyl/glutaminyl-tRNA synthetase